MLSILILSAEPGASDPPVDSRDDETPVDSRDDESRDSLVVVYFIVLLYINV